MRKRKGRQRRAARNMTYQKLAFSTFVLLCCAAAAVAAEVTGVVVDPSGQPIAGAQVAAFNAVGVITEQITDDRGHFDFYVSPLYEDVRLRVAAPGFSTTTVSIAASQIQLSIAPQTDSVRVTGFAMDMPASQQGSIVTVITSQELRDRNEPMMVDVLRADVPGAVFSQSGYTGSVTDLFLRGGDSKYNLVLLNGIPINSFYYGGLFDFAQIPTDFIEEIDVVQGPQSAIYGSYALSSVVNLETRSPQNGPALDVVAEGGTHEENRFAISGSGKIWKDLGIAGSLSSLLTNGPVQNSDYRNDNAFLALTERWRTQNFFAFGDFDSNNVGEPGPYGSNPVGLFPGLDTISRSKNNTSTYGFHWQDGITDKLRADLFTGFFLNNSFYISPYGDSFNKDVRAYADARATYSVFSHWTMAGGYSFQREEMKNTYLTDSNSTEFPLRRDDGGIYWENRFTFQNLYINAGLREEIYRNPLVPGDVYNYPPRPTFFSHTDTKLNPKISGAYSLPGHERLHASFGTGIRPPGGSDLAFTNNPALKPEVTVSYDIGIEQRFLNDRLSLDATWFHNSYKDLIVGLGGSLSELSYYSTDNLANSKAEGAEVSAQFRPMHLSWLSARASYTWLESEVLSLDGGIGLVQQYFYLGQPLLRRPKQSGSAVVTVHYGKMDANITGYFRGRDLDVEPNYGAYAGLFWDHGYKNIGINVNYRVRANLTVYANVRNALDDHYEEVYGYPSPFLTVVAGVKWSLARAR
ncbi:MAG: TonB-dependent receptor [Bryobacteraceae bacterium]